MSWKEFLFRQSVCLVVLVLGALGIVATAQSCERSDVLKAKAIEATRQCGDET